MNRMRGFGALTAVAIAVAATVGACTVKQNEDPTLTGPSTFVTAPSPAGPTANFTFTPTSPAANSPVAFDGSISCPEAGFTGGCVTSDRTITSFSWNFGDGTTGSSAVISHVFRAVGSFNVTLTVVSDRNLSSSLTKTVTVGAGSPPTADFVFSPTNPAVAQTVSFNASASKPGTGHQISTYAWDFGDGGKASGVNPTHGFGASGTYNVVLVVTDEVGQTATATKQVPVAVASSTPPPTALFVFSPTTPAAGQAVLFNATQSTASPGHTITSYSWNFGDGNTSTTGPTTSNTFVSAGTYQVVLKVTDDLGLTGTTTVPVPVSSSSNTAPPIASFAFSPQQPALGDTVTFDARNSTAAAGHSIASFKWTFGDNSGTVTATSPTGTTHVYSPASGAGTYVVVLVVTDDVGGTATATQNVQVGSPPAPTADFVATVNATTREVVFDASTSKAAQGQTITDYAWVFGDSATIVHVATKTTTHTYPGSGSFSVTLTITDSAGRTGVTSKSVVVP